MRARADRLQAATMLRDAGLSRKQIAAEMRVSDGYVRDLFNDPDRSKTITRRRLRYAGRCQVCNSPTDGSNGRAKAPSHCILHVPTTKYWTRDKVIQAIREWASGHEGKPPARRQWIKRQGPAFPSSSQVYGYRSQPFLRWADAIEAAGFTRPRSGHTYKRLATSTTPADAGSQQSP